MFKLTLEDPRRVNLVNIATWRLSLWSNFPENCPPFISQSTSCSIPKSQSVYKQSQTNPGFLPFWQPVLCMIQYDFLYYVYWMPKKPPKTSQNIQRPPPWLCREPLADGLAEQGLRPETWRTSTGGNRWKRTRGTMKTWMEQYQTCWLQLEKDMEKTEKKTAIHVFNPARDRFGFFDVSSSNWGTTQIKTSNIWQRFEKKPAKFVWLFSPMRVGAVSSSKAPRLQGSASPTVVFLSRGRGPWRTCSTDHAAVGDGGIPTVRGERAVDPAALVVPRQGDARWWDPRA